MGRKDEETREINYLYNQATRFGLGEDWFSTFLRFIKEDGLSPINAARKATQEDTTLNTLNEKRRL